MRLLPTPLIVVLSTLNVAQAGLVLVGAPQVVNWSDPQTASPIVQVDVRSDGASVEVSSWTLQLQIIGLPGSIGGVQFQSISAQPDYLFLGRGGSPGLNAAIVDNKGSVSDIDFGFIQNLPNVKITTAGSSLVDLDFVATVDAHGPFAVYALPFNLLDSGSFWTSVGAPAPQPFQNANTANGLLAMIFIGEPRSVVSESQSAAAWLTISALALATAFAGRLARYGGSMRWIVHLRKTLRH